MSYKRTELSLTGQVLHVVEAGEPIPLPDIFEEGRIMEILVQGDGFKGRLILTPGAEANTVMAHLDVEVTEEVK